MIVAAIVLEMQSPRLGGELRTAVAAFLLLGYLFWLGNVREFDKQFGLSLRWPLLPLTLYVTWCGLSLFWTTEPVETATESLLLAVGVFLVAVPAASIPARVFAGELVRVAVVLAAVSWVMAALVPSVAVLPDITWRLNGPMQHSQRLALVMGAAIIVASVLRRQGEQVFASVKRDRLALLLLALTLLATFTRANSAAAMIVVFAIFYAGSKPRSTDEQGLTGRGC